MHRPEGRICVHLHDQHAADACPPHRFQVGGNSLAGDVAIDPEPVDPGSGRIRRREEGSRCESPNILSRCRRGKDGSQPENSHKQRVAGLHEKEDIPAVDRRQELKTRPRNTWVNSCLAMSPVQECMACEVDRLTRVARILRQATHCRRLPARVPRVRCPEQRVDHFQGRGRI